MRDALYDEAAGRQVVGLEVNADLYGKAKLAGLDTSGIVEQALADALRARHREVLRAEIEQDIVALAAYVAEHGNPMVEIAALSECDDGDAA